MNGLLYYMDDDGEYKKLGDVKDIPIITDSELEKESEAVRNFIQCKEISIECTIENNGKLNPLRQIASGGDSGIYNGMTLMADGYLSGENAWL